MAGGGNGGKVVMASWQDRAIICPAQCQGDGIGVLDGDDRGTLGELLETVGGAVFFGVVRVELLDVDILIIGVGRGDSPTQSGAAARQDCGNARDRTTDDAAGLQTETGQVPNRRCREPEVRIIGNQRAAGRRTIARCGPCIRRPGKIERFEG